MTRATRALSSPTATSRCIEVACILYDLVHAAPIASCSYLIAADENPAEAVNGIPTALLQRSRFLPDPWDMCIHMAESADVILAHRSDFDRSFVPLSIRDAKPWVCTKFHVQWPKGKLGDALVPLALAHGVGVVHAHRAMSDCDTLARILTRVHEMGNSLPELIVKAMRPRKRVVALVSYDDREKAKQAGFAWDPQKREWWRDMPVEEIGGLGFEVRS